MARKMSENSLKNLKPLNARPKKEQRKIQSAGGKKSVQVRREAKAERESLKTLLEVALSMLDKDTGETNDYVMVQAVIEKAKKGDLSAFSLIRDTIGEKPVDKTEFSITPPTIVDDI